MLSALICLLILVIVKSGSLKPIALPLNFHTISTGKSPFIIEQVAETMSPEFAGPSLIENGPICGATTTTWKLALAHIREPHPTLINGYQFSPLDGRERPFLGHFENENEKGKRDHSRREPRNTFCSSPLRRGQRKWVGRGEGRNKDRCVHAKREERD